MRTGGTSRRAWAIGLGVCMILGVTACRNGASGIRRYTYPPDFDYITPEQLQSAMWTLASQIRYLDVLLDREDPVDQAAVVSLLAEIDVTVGRLDRGGRSRNHPVLGPHLQEFRSEVQRARLAAAATPPRYFLAGTVSGGCSHCHGFRN